MEVHHIVTVVADPPLLRALHALVIQKGKIMTALDDLMTKVDALQVEVDAHNAKDDLVIALVLDLKKKMDALVSGNGAADAAMITQIAAKLDTIHSALTDQDAQNAAVLLESAAPPI